jgi:hypothetical protein
VDVAATIDGTGAAAVNAGSVSLTALDHSTITANAGAASLAIAFAKGDAVSLAIGVALAHNDIANNVEASVSNVPHLTTTRTTTGDVTLTATEEAKISTVAVAASVAASFSTQGQGLTVALSGAGANATNTIGTDTNAYVTNSALNVEHDRRLQLRLHHE